MHLIELYDIKLYSDSKALPVIAGDFQEKILFIESFCAFIWFNQSALRAARGVRDERRELKVNI